MTSVLGIEVEMEDDSYAPVKPKRKSSTWGGNKNVGAKRRERFAQATIVGRCARCQWSETGTGPQVREAFAAHGCPGA